MAITSGITTTNMGLGGTAYGVGTPYAAEDVYDVIQMQANNDTPFFNSAPKSTAKNVYHHWLGDTMPVARAVGFTEGADWVGISGTTGDSVYTNRTRLWNITQIFRRGVSVPGTVVDMLDELGVSDEYTYQTTKATQALTNDIEYTTFSNDYAFASGEKRQMYTLYTFGGASASAACAQGGVGTQYIRTDAIGTTITLAQLNSLSETLVTIGSKPDVLFCSPGVKADITTAIIGAAGVAPIQGSAAGSNPFYMRQQPLDKQVSNIRVIENDFCVFPMVSDIFIPQGSASAYGQAAYLMERSAARIAIGRPIRHKPLPPNGDSVRGLVLGELTIEILRPSGIGIIDRLIT